MKVTKWMLAGLMLCAVASCKKDDDEDTNTLNDTDRQFMMNASYSNNAEVDAGGAAASMGLTASVRNFGAMMVADHTTAQNELRLIGSQVGVTNLPTTPDSAHIAMKQKLMMMSGRAFDSAYMKMQVVDHQSTINLLQNEINNGRHQSVKNYASSKLPNVQMHKRMADSIVAANGY